MAAPRVGFVGLGAMGMPMVANLVAAGFELIVRDMDPDRQNAVVERLGCRSADDCASFAVVDVLITMLPDDRAVAGVLLEGGVSAALPRGAVVVDMSSSNPVRTQELGKSLPEGVGLVDAPVSGGVARAETGTLSIMCGSDDPQAIERVRPVLEALGDRIFLTGKLGSAHALKALNNYLAAATYAAGTEALLVGSRFGLDPKTMLDVINTSTGRSFISEVVLGENVVTGRYATGFALGLLAKDVRNARELAEMLACDVPALELTSRRWTDAAAVLGEQVDHSMAHRGWWPAEPDGLRAVDVQT